MPVIVAPMFLVSGVELVTAACRAGVIGAFPAPNARTIDVLDGWCAEIALRVSGSSAPWALGVVAHRSYPRLAAEVELIAAHRPPVVITALGSPQHVVDTVHAYRGLVLADVATTGQACKAAEAGVDGLLLVCAGAGGHTGQYSPFAFVEEVRAFWPGPIALAGGVGTGRAIAAALVAGADLVSVGTRFIATHESLVSDAYREMVVSAQLSDLVVSDALTGAPAVWLRPSLEAAGAAAPSAVGGIDFSTITGGEQRRWRDVWSAGNGLVGARRIASVADVVDELEREYAAAIPHPFPARRFSCR